MPIKKISVLTLGLFVFATLAFGARAQEQQQEPQSNYEVTVPSGTVIPITLTAYLNTRSSQVGDIIYADTTYPIWIQQRLAIPKGSTIRGTLTEVLRPGRIKGGGRIAVRFNDILLPNGVKRDLVASLHGIHGEGDVTYDRKKETVSGGTSKADDVGTIVGGMSTGAMAGVILTRSSGGVASGGLAGAAAGVAGVLLTRGKDLVLNPGTQFDLELLKPMTFTFGELEFTESELRNVRREIRTIRPPEESSRSPFGKKRTGGIF
jgi:hypothetical protein